MTFDIISVGSATRDVYIKSKEVKYIKSPKFKTGIGECFTLGSKVDIEKIYFTTGGSAINSAISFSRLGLKSAALARVGDDIRGEEIIKALREEKVYTGFLQKDPECLTAYSIIMLTPTGERTILIYRGATEDISKREIPWKKLKTKWFYIGHLAGKSKELFKPFIEFAQRKNIKVALNPGSTQLKMSEGWWKNILNKIDILILNREEASYMTRIPFQDERKIFEKLDDWVKGIVVMTEGPGGVWVSDGNYRWKAGILKEKKVEDRTGAGDAFSAGFIAGFIRKNIKCQKDICYPKINEIEYAIQLASANATSQIERLGAREGLLYKNQSIYKWGKLSIKKLKI